jgi:hypothetical protein
MSLPTIKGIKGNLRTLLGVTDFKSINALLKFSPDLKNRKQAEQFLLDNYNDIIENINENARIRIEREKERKKTAKRIYKNEAKKEAKDFLKNSFKIEDETIKRIKPTIQTTNRFKKASKELKLSNSNSDGFQSLRILNSSIPTLRETLKEFKGMKVVLEFTLLMERNETGELVEYNSILNNTQVDNIVLNIQQVNSFIENAKTYMRNFIPELETEKTGWKFKKVLNVIVSIAKYQPLTGSSYLPLDKYVENKKCCVNIKNEDDKCLMYCILYHIHKNEIKDHPERVSKYATYLNEFDWSKIKFPVSLNDIEKVEELIDYGINVYGYENKSTFPLRISKRKDDKIINLLLIGSLKKEQKVNHYVYIKKLDILVTPNKRTEGEHHNKNKYTCVNCLHGFSTEERLKKHREGGCDIFEPVKTIMPTWKKTDDGEFIKPTIQFQHHNRKFNAPVTIYADFETLINKYSNPHNESTSSTTKLADLPPCGYSFNIVSDYPELNMGFQLYRGKDDNDDIVEHFLKNLCEYGDKIRKILDTQKKMVITHQQEKEFQKASFCHICEKPFEKDDVKVRDHDHINGLYRGCSHQDCNLNLNHKNFKIPVYFHNLKGFDGHLIIQGLKKMNFSNIQIIAQNFEKYMTFSFGEFRFLDSFAFMSSSLDTLSSNLLKDGQENFKNTLNGDLNEKQKKLILSKGVYPYEYMDSYEKFNETELPSIDKFYSTLTESHISKEDYEHAKQVWKEFNIKNLGEYHDLYLKTDVLLLSDVFETFRKTAIKNYGLDPAQGYFTLPNYAWDAMLKMTGVVLDQLTDIDMYQFCEQAIRGGTSMISHRYAKANNKYMKDFIPDAISSYIIYLDANNLYGEAMTQKLPISDFKWVYNIDDNDIVNFDANEEYGLYVECDLHYPKELHDLHNNYPLAVESRSILKSELSPYQLNQLETHKEGHSEKLKKLVPNLYDKKNYICHIKNLQYYLKKGLVLTKIHRVLKFKQSAWLKPYIDFNTTQRTLSKNDFEKDLYKLMNNAVFGKTMENMRGRVDIQLYTDEKLALKQFAKPQYLQSKIYSEDLIAIKKVKKEVKLDKPIFVGVAVLDLSKLHMYKFHYDYIKEKYGEKATLLFTDTDSLTYHIETEDLYKDMDDNKELFDRSGYNGTGYRSCDNMNKKVIGKFKDETDGKLIIEFCGLRSKMYSVLLDDGKQKMTGKGIKKCALKKYITHQDYKRCLLGEIKDQRQLVSFNNFRTFNHEIAMYRYTKVGLSCSNDKQYLLDDGITSYSYGHYKISENR